MASTEGAEIWDSGTVERVGPSCWLMNGAGESGFVNYDDAGRRLKMKLRLRNWNVFFPIAKAKFGFDISGFAKDDADKAGLGVSLQKDLAQRIGCVDRFTGAIPWRAAQDGVAVLQRAIFRLSAGCRGGIDDINVAAQSRKTGLRYQQRNRRTPIRTIFYLRAARGVIRWNVKPNVAAINKEKLLFRRFVVPAHSARAGKVDGARFGLRGAFAVRVALEKHCFKRARVAVARFESVRGGLGIRDGPRT
jgi:hypothetical protein